MGYYTKHSLQVIGGVPGYSYEEEIGKVSEYGPCVFDDSYKWRSFEEDMNLVSNKHLDVLFVVNGEGEESGDLWISYSKNGVTYRDIPEIVYPSFDPSKLEAKQKSSRPQLLIGE